MKIDRLTAYMQLAENDVRLEYTNDIFGPRFYLTSKHWFDEFCPSWNADCYGTESKTADAELSLAKLRALVTIKLLGLPLQEARNDLKLWEPEGKPDFRKWVKEYIEMDGSFTEMLENFNLVDYKTNHSPRFNFRGIQKFLQTCETARREIYVNGRIEQVGEDILYEIVDFSEIGVPKYDEEEEYSWGNSAKVEIACFKKRAAYVLIKYGVDPEEAKNALKTATNTDKYGRLNWISWAFETLAETDLINVK